MPSEATLAADKELGRLVHELLRVVIDEVTPALAAKLVPAVVSELHSSNGCDPSSAALGGAQYIGIKEAASLMSAHPSTVRKLVAEGKLGRYLLEGKLRVKVSDIHAYLARGGEPSPTIDIHERALEILGKKRRG